MADLPAYAKIREIRLRVMSPNAEARRPLTRRAPYAPAAREMWHAQIAFADMTRADAHAFAAFLESLDGRVDVLTFTLPAGVFGRAHPVTSGTVAATVAGANTLTVSKSGTAVLERGTLLGIGDPNTDTYQLVEVVGGGSAATSQTVHVAPRVRQAFAAGTPVAIGTATARVRLAFDAVGSTRGLTTGAATLEAYEAI